MVFFLRGPKFKTYVRNCKIACVGILAICNANFLVSQCYMMIVRRTETYKNIFETIRKDEQFMNFIGAPMKEGNITFYPPEDELRKFSVKLRGKRKSGILDCELLIPDQNQLPLISKVKLRVSDNPDEDYILHEGEPLNQLSLMLEEENEEPVPAASS